MKPTDCTQNEEGNGLPEGWLRTQFGNVVWPSKNKMEPDKQPEARYLGLEHIEAHTGKILGVGRASEVKSTKSVFRAGDVLYGKLRPYLNKVAAPDFGGVCSTDFIVFDQKIWLNNRLLLWFLLQREVVEYANHNSTGVELPRISYEKLAALDFLLPPLAEQHRIVAGIEKCLTRVNSARDCLSRVREILIRFRQAVLAAACSGSLTEDWRAQSKEPRSSGREFADRLWQRRLGESNKSKSWPMDETFLPQANGIPDTWHWESLSRCTDVRDGTHDSPKYQQTGVPLVTSKNLVHNRIDFGTAKFISPEDHLQIAKRSAVEKGDILFAMIGTIGNPTIVDCDRAFSIKNVALFRTLGNRLLSRWLSIWLESPHATRIFQEIAKGSTQPFVPLIVFRGLPIPLPPTDELRQIIRRVDQLLGHAEEVEEHHQAASRNVDKLTQAILAKAFKGELVPTEAELARREGREYEPASVLLERVKKDRGGNHNNPKKAPDKRCRNTALMQNA